MGLFGGGSQKVKPITLTPGIHHGINTLTGSLMQLSDQPSRLDATGTLLRRQQAQAARGSRILPESMDLASQTLRGDFLSGGNPYLQSAMMPAQQAFTDQISQIGGAAMGAGRFGSGVHQNMAQRAAQTLADSQNRIAFENYERERQRQMQTMGQAGQLFTQSLLPTQIATQTALQREERGDQDYNRMLQLLSVLQGSPMGQSVSQSSNILGNIIGLGSLAGGLFGGFGGGGAAAGSAMSPGQSALLARTA